jgi:hypothetical protein
VHRRAPTYRTDPEVEALLNGPDHSAGAAPTTRRYRPDDQLLTFLETLLIMPNYPDQPPP